ncbi:cytochrome c biogenesis CcdA family protein [Paenibacillus turpanensis]|uniref:cytochrome c biogenesis CcdA family protein n=1 Tax=Paenibacillus turpanensis TaxID=2689078 RepID=UPI001409EB53|nr:sulfite exporter TauE/SafE family protein [Paenibacillus turpanensis]
MYEFFSKISYFFSGPLFLAAQTDIALLSALFLGFVGAVAPCQISANAAATMYFANRHMQNKHVWQEAGLYLVGKVVVFTGLEILFSWLGRELANELIPIFSWSRKLLGPLLIIIGAFFLGFIRIPIVVGLNLSHFLQKHSRKLGGKSGAFFLGASFSLGFCPTMFVLFYGTLIPLNIGSSWGYVLPSIFAVGTAMPFLLFTGLAVVFGLDQKMVRWSKRWGSVLQRGLGFLLLGLGIADTMTYWLISL